MSNKLSEKIADSIIAYINARLRPFAALYFGDGADSDIRAIIKHELKDAGINDD